MSMAGGGGVVEWKNQGVRQSTFYTWEIPRQLAKKSSSPDVFRKRILSNLDDRKSFDQGEDFLAVIDIGRKRWFSPWPTWLVLAEIEDEEGVLFKAGDLTRALKKSGQFGDQMGRRILYERSSLVEEGKALPLSKFAQRWFERNGSNAAEQLKKQLDS
ncbi:MAG: hypothetical protein QM809_16155 [Gordonia sp. (in: high G+C Gram-positive bacteria)]|uniref:hypothetical protein n=1 Tax=Gordonia sp. (in: high G+C Gram-positive bacteria) TaxID=84139 RepID=UPI0039E35091